MRAVPKVQGGPERRTRGEYSRPGPRRFTANHPSSNGLRSKSEPPPFPIPGSSDLQLAVRLQHIVTSLFRDDRKAASRPPPTRRSGIKCVSQYFVLVRLNHPFHTLPE